MTAPFTAPLVLSVLIVCSSPVAGELRSVLQAATAEWFGIGVVLALAAAVLAVAAAGVYRDRASRQRRVLLLTSAAATAVLWGRLFATGVLEVDAVEHVHFLEYGLVSVLFHRAWSSVNARPVPPAALSALLVGIADEWVQWIVPGRVGEIRDVFLNGGAIAAGLLCAAAWPSEPTLGDRKGLRVDVRPVAWLCAAAIVSATAFVDAAHLGHEIVTSRSTVFRSRYTASELLYLSHDREARWRVSPRQPSGPLSVEDQYLTEALWHVAARNTAWGTGDRAAAWRENAVLEEFFAPVLSVSSDVNPSDFRWPDAQRDDARRRAELDQGRWVSRAQRVPILTWSRRLLWTVVAIALVLLVRLAKGARVAEIPR